MSEQEDAGRIEVDMDKTCRVCGAPGVVEKSGACMDCTERAMRQLGYDQGDGERAPAGSAGVSGAPGQPAGKVEAGEVKDVPWPKLKKVLALRIVGVHPEWCLRMAERPVPSDLRDMDSEVRTCAGWCGRNPLETFEGPCGGEVNAGLVFFERKPPASLVSATVERELAQWHRERGFKAGKAVRAEIRQRVTDALTAGAQWKPSSNRVVMEDRPEVGGLAFTDATGGNALDAVLTGLSGAGIKVLPVTAPELLARRYASPEAFGDRPPCAYGFGRPLSVGAEFMAWACWKACCDSSDNDCGPFSVDTPFVTASKASKEEIKAGGERNVWGMLRDSLAGGRQLVKMRLRAGAVKLALNEDLALTSAGFSYGEPETALAAARVAWCAMESVFSRYADRRARPELWERDERSVAEWIKGLTPESGRAD